MDGWEGLGREEKEGHTHSFCRCRSPCGNWTVGRRPFYVEGIGGGEEEEEKEWVRWTGK